MVNVIVLQAGKPCLIESTAVDKYNHSTVSQVVVKAMNDYGIEFGNVVGIVYDSAAYCKKAFKDVLSALLL